MRRRFPLMLRLTFALLLTLAVPVGALAGFSYYLDRSIRLDVEQRAETTLNMAIAMEENLLREALDEMRHAAVVAAADVSVVSALQGGKAAFELGRIKQIFPRADLLTVVDTQGTVRARVTSDRTGDRVQLDGLVPYAVSSGEVQAYPTLIGPDELAGEGTAILQQVDMKILETGGSTDPRVGGRVDTALALAGVAPVRLPSGDVIGAVIAADILNRDFRIVDDVARWASTGTPMNATIAMGGVRVTTNVRLRDPEGNPSEHRALGTVYSDAVMKSLSTAGIHRGRAQVVGEWRRTIYKAMNDFQGRMIAAPYVGISESYFTTVEKHMTGSLRVSVWGGGAAVLVGLLIALWIAYQGAVAPLRRLISQLRDGESLEHKANDEIGDLGREVQERLDRWSHALREGREASDRIGAMLEQLPSRPDAEGQLTVPAAAGLRWGATGAQEQLQQLSGSIRTLLDGVRHEERSIGYVGRVAHEIAAGLAESRETVEAAVADVGQLTASARAALKQSGEFAAGLALLRQSMQGTVGHHALDLLRDPSDMMASLSALSERVAGEVRTLVLVLQENQARLAFIREEMNRVGAVVQSNAAATQVAAQAAGEVIGRMEGMAATAVSVADEMLAARAGLESAAEANRELQEWCRQVHEQLARFRQAVDEAQGKA